MKVIAVIPARYASTRFPAKLMQDLGGKTVILRTYEAAVNTGLFQDVFVVTDSILIYDEIINNGGKAIMSLKEHESGSDRIAEAVEHLEVDIVVNVQGDEPLIDPDLVEQVALALQNDKSASMSTAAHTITDSADFFNPNVVKVVLNQKNHGIYFSRAPIPWWRDGNTQGIQQLPSPAPLRHIGIYGYRVGFLKTFPTLPPAPIETCEALEQLRANNAMLKEQSAITAGHQAEQREVIRQLREELQQQRDAVADMQLEQDKLKKQKSQLEQQVSFVKDNAAATIERLTRYREQAQEKIEKLEKKLGENKA